MRNDSRTTGTSDDGFRRIEVINGVGRRRRWTEEEKAWIVAESLDPATSVSAVARRYGLHPSQLFVWRQQLADALHAWLTVQLGRVSGKSGLAEAIRYVQRHWQGLVLFLDDGRLELDTNTVERAIRPISLGRKNALFAGSDGGACWWAIVASLVATAKLNGVEPLAWLTDVLERVVSGRTKAHELDALLPWSWKAARPVDT